MICVSRQGTIIYISMILNIINYIIRVIFFIYLYSNQYMSKHNKKSAYQKNDFSDQEVYEQIKDNIRQIRDKNLKAVQEAEMIYDLYNRSKQEKKRKLMKQKDGNKSHLAYNMPFHSKNSSEDDQEGEINQKKLSKPEYNFNDFQFQGVPSISNLGDHIRPLTLTRNKIADLLNSRRFQQLVKGCFVRYLSDNSSSSNSSSYIIAQIVGVTEGTKQYTISNVKTKILLKLQETSQNIVTLSLQLISNQHPPGGLQIQKWLQTNRNKIPKEKQLKQKLQEHNKLLVEQLSSSEIDINIWKKAKKIAEQDAQPKEDITHLIDFIGDKLHNLQLQLEQGQIGRKSEKVDLHRLKQEINQAQHILQKLKQIRDKFLTAKQKQKKQQKKSQRKLQLFISQQKRKDAINQRCKARTIMLATIDGYNKLKNTIMQNHQKYSFDLDEF